MYGGYMSELTLILYVLFYVWIYFITCVVKNNF